MFVVLSVELAGGGELVFDGASRQAAVFLGLFLIFAYVEIDGAVAFVGETGVKDFLHQLYLLDDVA